jgi:hypothetical protein
MQDGFLIQVTNTADIDHELELFSKLLSNGLHVQSLDGSLDYASLRKISLDQGFIGNSITSNAIEIIHLEIHNNGQSEHVDLNGRFEKSDIKVDGKDNYIKVSCPANSIFTLRLFSIPDHIL